MRYSCTFKQMPALCHLKNRSSLRTKLSRSKQVAAKNEQLLPYQGLNFGLFQNFQSVINHDTEIPSLSGLSSQLDQQYSG